MILDAFSRKVVGWALDRMLAARLPIAALEQANAKRQAPPGLVITPEKRNFEKEKPLNCMCTNSKLSEQKGSPQPSVNKLSNSCHFLLQSVTLIGNHARVDGHGSCQSNFCQLRRASSCNQKRIFSENDRCRDNWFGADFGNRGRSRRAKGAKAFVRSRRLCRGYCRKRRRGSRDVSGGAPFCTGTGPQFARDPGTRCLPGDQSGSAFVAHHRSQCAD